MAEKFEERRLQRNDGAKQGDSHAKYMLNPKPPQSTSKCQIVLILFAWTLRRGKLTNTRCLRSNQDGSFHHLTLQSIGLEWPLSFALFWHSKQRFPTQRTSSMFFSLLSGSIYRRGVAAEDALQNYWRTHVQFRGGNPACPYLTDRCHIDS